MHKGLRLPEDLQRDYPPPLDSFYTDDLALGAANLPENPRVLDAGSGFGASVFRWCERLPGCYHGLTLSRVQRKVARREARRRGLEHQCHFFLQSYDHCLPDTYDGIIAIEALIHSPALERSIANLCAGLHVGGRIVLVEDMASPELDVYGDPDAQMLRQRASLSDFPTILTYRTVLAKHGLVIVDEQDHSEFVVTPSSAEIERNIARYSAFRRACILPGPRQVADALLSIFALQRLYQRGLATYRVLVGRKVAS